MDTRSTSQGSLPVVQPSQPHIGGAIETSDATHAVCYVANLPVELMQQIFLDTFSQRLLEFPAFVGTDAVPLRLCHVCQAWREVAIDTPTLWATMFVTDHFSPSLVKMWLERSQAQSLILAIDNKYIDGLKPRCVIMMVKWETRDANTAEKLLQCISKACPQLETLEIDIERLKRKEHGGFLKGLPQVLDSSAHLHTLVYHARKPFLLPMSLFRLTCLRLHCPIPANECGQLLFQCARLQHLTIKAITKSSPVSAPTNICLPELVSLELHSYGCDWGILLVQLICPQLLELNLHHRDDTTDEDDTTDGDLYGCEQFLRRSNCLLRAFTLFSTGISERDLVRLFKVGSLFLLEVLIIVCDKLSNQTINGLTLRADNKILPNLTTISMASCYSTDGRLAAMLASRYPGELGDVETCLQSAYIGLGAISHDGELIKGLSEDEGLAIRNAHRNDTRFQGQDLKLVWKFGVIDY
ncbi:hypothetical protein Hypma_006243 [Hypsizygus marmoreus]|uniref:Uncharacterized protein n=1 Tax=Hypsizygus marmoreus TaxID=39966 RepID=A0A369JWE1_HYPMA|nr:hypothetical protein Hypma_006243 [Hypsizygus marmoreus]